MEGATLPFRCQENIHTSIRFTSSYVSFARKSAFLADMGFLFENRTPLHSDTKYQNTIFTYQ